MKKLINFSMIMVMAIILGISTSCSAHNTEVEEFIGEFENCVPKIKKCDNFDDVLKANDNFIASLEKFTESTVQLTDNDYKAIANAMIEVTKAVYEFRGENFTISEESVIEEVSKYKTLGDLATAVRNGSH